MMSRNILGGGDAVDGCTVRVAEDARWREIRQRKGYSQRQVAELADITHVTYFHIEHGGNVRLETIFRLLKVLDCTFWEVYGK